jgi:hypothetical protein
MVSLVPTELVAHPEDVATLGQKIRDSVLGFPEALNHFIQTGVVNPSAFGTTSQDQSMGKKYGQLCQDVQALCPMLHDAVDTRGSTVQTWGHFFATHDKTMSEHLANIMNGGR